MRLKVGDSNADKYDVIDVSTGVRIPGVQEVDDETGEISLFLVDYFTGQMIESNNKIVIFKFKGNIELRKKGGIK